MFFSREIQKIVIRESLLPRKFIPAKLYTIPLRRLGRGFQGQKYILGLFAYLVILGKIS